MTFAAEFALFFAVIIVAFALLLKVEAEVLGRLVQILRKELIELYALSILFKAEL